MLATKAITVRIDETVKNHAEKILDEIGMNMTTYIVSSLKALLREQRIPFALATAQHLNDQFIVQKLAEAQQQANNPDTHLLSHQDLLALLREKYGYEVQN